MPVQKQAGSGLETFTFYLSLLLLVAAIGSFFYLQYLASQRNAEFVTLTSEMTKNKTAEQKNLENRILTVRQQLRDFAAALEERKLGTGFFSKFEGLVFPQVYFTKCDLNMPELKASLAGHTTDFETLGRQISEFEAASDVFDKVTLGKAGAAEKGGIDFEVEFYVKDATFKSQ